jgi:hypothetical protein
MAGIFYFAKLPMEVSPSGMMMPIWFSWILKVAKPGQ